MSKNTKPSIDLSVCRVCGKKIEISIFKNSGYCCGLCKKADTE